MSQNLREKRFEVLDSMRSLDDENLRSCCNEIVLGVKELWDSFYKKSRKEISNYDIVEIEVPNYRSRQTRKSLFSLVVIAFKRKLDHVYFHVNFLIF